MKKIISLLTVLVLMLAVTACSKKEDEGDHLARILKAGEISIALEGAWQPFGYHNENDELVGFDVEVAKGIAAELGVTPVFVEGDFDGGLTGVSTGMYDMMVNGVDITEDRKATFDFSDPYAYDHVGLVVRTDNDTVKSFEDLEGLITANSIGSTYMELGESYGATCKGVDTLAETMELVLNGSADATINAETSIADYLTTTGETNLKVVATTSESAPYAIPMKKGADNDTLVEAVNKALATMRDNGTLAELSIKYFGSDLTQE